MGNRHEAMDESETSVFGPHCWECPKHTLAAEIFIHYPWFIYCDLYIDEGFCISA